MKGQYQQVERQPTAQEKIFANHICGKELISRIYFLKNPKIQQPKNNNPAQKWRKDLNGHLFQKDRKWPLST